MQELMDALWADYTAITPLAARVHALLAARGETVINDHIALRTFRVGPESDAGGHRYGLGGAPGIGIDALARPFEALGWEPRDHYRFDDKHLNARYWQHADPALPKVFISELCVGELPAAAQAAIAGLVAQLPAGFGERTDLPHAGRPWTVRHDTYGELLGVSEYAAWMAAFGFRVNHFTVDVGRLKTIASIAEMNRVLVEGGFELNTAGGAIKGTPADRLEQSSTRAEEIDVPFEDITVRIPSCYYEFAKRYPLPDGTLFQGFVPRSADKIFESTDVVR